MDKELQQLQAPKRSNEIRQLSYTTIQTKIAQRKKRQNIHYYSIVMAAAVLFMLLATSFFNNNTELVVNEQTATSPLTIEKGYITTNESTEDLMHMTKWYYFDKNKVSNYDLAIIQPIIEKLYASSQQLESFPQAPQEQLLLVMSDGRVTQLSLLNDQVNNQYLLVDVNTKQVLKLTMDESMDITAIYLDSGNKLLLFIVELFFILLLVILYVNTVLKISPQKKEKLALKHTKYYFLAGIGTYIVYSIVSGFSLYYFHSYNGLFIASVMASLLLAKTLIEYYNGRFDRSILEVPIFFIFILLFTFVKLL
mgnify:CR=1 FL=1